MNLPSNYVRVDYIESTGTQYINTGFNPNQDTRVVLCGIKKDTTTYFIFGANNNGAPNFAVLNPEDANVTRLNYKSAAANASVTRSQLRNNPFIIDANKNKLTVTYGANKTTVSASATYSSFQIINPIYLFARNSGAAISSPVKIKIFYAQIYDNGTLVRDYVPVKNQDTGELGLYDLVNDVFYTNQGTGSFVYGHELTENIYLEDNPLNFIANEDVEVQANFKVRYNITINYDSTLGTASYMWGVGNQIILTATPNANAQFLGWYKGTTLISQSLQTTYNVNEDTTLEARFERIYNINSSVVGSGAISYNRQQSDENQVEFYVIPSEHYHFVKYVLDGVEYTTTPLNVRLQNDCTIVAYFEEDSKYNVNVSSSLDKTSVYVSSNYVYEGESVDLWARPFPNYVFEKWSDGNYENPRTIVVNEETTLIAEYKHIIETNGIYQYRCFVKDQLDMEAPPKAFMVVDTFDLKQDYLTNANSSINVLQMADNVNNGDVIVVYNPKGEVIYNGVITAISDLKISTSQMQSFYKGTWIYNTHPSTYIEEEIAYLLGQYAQGKMYGSSYTDNLVAQRLGGITIQHTNSISGALPTDLDDNGNPKYTTKDMEKWIYELYANYGIVFDFTINMVGTNYVEIKVPTYSSISVGNNHYAIDNLTPMQTIEETNRLIIYAKDKTYRTTYVATTSGIVEQPISTANRFNITNTKVVFSDDDVSDLVEANLPTQTINHKISFDLLLKNNLYEFKDFKLGMPIEIYYNGTDYYNSVITARKLKKDTNQNVSVVSYTCGNVRTTITSKISLGKV